MNRPHKNARYNGRFVNRPYNCILGNSSLNWNLSSTIYTHFGEKLVDSFSEIMV